ARNTQIFLQQETQITRSVDPWAGSRLLEERTEEIAVEAWELFQEIEKLGGMTKAIEAGIPKMRIEEAAAKKQARIDSGQDIIVGVNKHAREKEDPRQSLEVDNAKVRKQQVERLTQIKKERDPKAVEQSLERIREASQKLLRKD